MKVTFELPKEEAKKTVLKKGQVLHGESSNFYLVISDTQAVSLGSETPGWVELVNLEDIYETSLIPPGTKVTFETV